MSSAHFLLVGFASSREPALAEWHRTADVVDELRPVGDAPPVLPGDPSDPVLGWRIVAPNSRVLARSARLFATESDARESIATVIADADSLAVRLLAAPSLRGFGWYAAGVTHTDIMCARWYEGRAIAQNAGRLVARILRENAPLWMIDPPTPARVDVSTAPRAAARKR